MRPSTLRNAAFVELVTGLVVLFAPSQAWTQPILGGFVEGVQAFRVEKNVTLGDDGFLERSYPRSEMRAQLTGRLDEARAGFFVRTDIVSDGRETQIGYERERFSIDLREAYIKVHVADWFDIKAGRQVATWGTGDLIFANDLFAKDWEAFFTGLDDSYLKAPQDLVRLTFYSGSTIVEGVFSPYFTPDELPAHWRMSYFNPYNMEMTGSYYGLSVRRPKRDLYHGQAFARVTHAIGNGEAAAYGYLGHTPTPEVLLDEDGFPRVEYIAIGAFGASLRGPIGGFLSYSEVSAHIARRDELTNNPEAAKSDIRGFVGTEKSLGHEWTIGSQYYAEWMMDYDEYLETLPPGSPAFDEVRSTVTLRLTKLARHQTVKLSVFGFWGISDEDWHLRPSIEYNVTDAVKWTVGASLLDGEKPYTTFGQFRGNSNAYTRLRYSF